LIGHVIISIVYKKNILDDEKSIGSYHIISGEYVRVVAWRRLLGA
jgi:hypothetical protein